jgi:hypothetical protein
MDLPVASPDVREVLLSGRRGIRDSRTGVEATEERQLLGSGGASAPGV